MSRYDYEGLTVVDDGDWSRGNEAVGPLTVAALLRGHSPVSLKHRLAVLSGTAWGTVAERVSGANGDAGERLFEATAGLREPGLSEAETRRGFLAEIARFDGFVDAWLELDPEFTRRRSLPTTTVADVENYFGEIEWLWDRWIPRGYLSLLVGRPGAGKSYVGMWIASALLSGGRLPDGTIPEKDDSAKVIWIDTEGTQQLLVDRLKILNAPRSRFLWPRDPRNTEERFPLIDLSKPYWTGILADVAITTRPIWIVVDSLRGSHRGDENSSEVQEVLSTSAAIARDVGCGFTFVHHLRKGFPGETNEIDLDRIRGSSVFSAMARTIVALERPDPTRKAERLRVIKSNLGLAPEAVGVEIGDSGPFSVSDVPELSRPPSVVERAREFLLARLRVGPVASEEIFSDAEAAGISRRSLTRAKSELGIVAARIEKHWEWALPAARGELAEGAPF